MKQLVLIRLRMKIGISLGNRMYHKDVVGLGVILEIGLKKVQLPRSVKINFRFIYVGHRNSSGRTGMLKNLIIDPTHQDCVPESVILVMKQILAIEQTFNVQLFTKLGIMTAPPPGTGKI